MRGPVISPTNSPFEQFIREKQYINNVSPKTIRTYRDSLKAFEKFAGCSCPQYLTAKSLRSFVVTAGGCGVSPGAINTFARSVNSYLTWLHREGHISEPLAIPKVKQPKRIIPTYSADDVVRILSHKPRNHTERRLLTVLALLVDTGLRIEEALILRRAAIDLDSLVITVKGKGQKDRIVPFSIECRKVLFKWLQAHRYDTVFPTRDGRQLRYDNLRNDFVALLHRVGVEQTEGAFHAFRRFCARQYLRNGGSIRYLQVMLGHSDITTTTKYLDNDIEAVRSEHLRVSPLESLKRR
jgi:integrase/recombinase XerD